MEGSVLVVGVRGGGECAGGGCEGRRGSVLVVV